MNFEFHDLLEHLIPEASWMAVFSLTPMYSVPSPSPVPQSELSEDMRLRTASRALRTGRISGELDLELTREDIAVLCSLCYSSGN